MPTLNTSYSLTHAWGDDGVNHQRVGRLNDELARRGLKTWFDRDKMTGMFA